VNPDFQVAKRKSIQRQPHYSTSPLNRFLQHVCQSRWESHNHGRDKDTSSTAGTAGSVPCIEHPSISAPLRPTKGVLAKQGKAWAYLRLCRLAHCMDINFDISSTPPRYLGGDSTIGRNCSTAGACLHVQQYQPDPEASQASHVL